MNTSSSAVALNPYDYRIHRPIIYTVVSVFTVLGTFGNLQLIAVHLRKATLRTKYGILLCSLSTFQTLCLFFEWVGVVYTLINPIISRPGCYRLLFFYVFVHCMQTGILATISADLLISIVLPVKHRTWRHYPYCLLICLPAMAYGLISVALGFIFLDDAAIQMCNPPNSLQKTANEFWYFGALLAGGIVIANYALAYAIINVKSRRDRAPMETERRAMRSLSVILFVFVFSRYIGVLVSNLLIFTNADPALISLYQSYNAFFAMALYSQNFYVCYWRSSDYRHHLKEQIVLSLLCALLMYYKLVNDTCANSLTVFESLTTCRPYNLLTGVALCISSFYGIPLMAYMTWQLGHLKFKKSSYYIWVFLQTLCDLTSLTTDSLRFGDSDYTLSDVSAIACELSLTANTGISLEWKKQLREWKIVDRLLWIASVTCVVILIPCQLSYTAAYYTEASPLLYNFTLLLQDVNLIILPVWAFVSAGITYLCLFAVVIVDKKTFSTVTMKGYKKVAFALTVKTILYSDMYLMPYSVGRILGAFNWLNVAEGEWFNLLPPSITRYLYPTCNAILNYWAMRGLWRKTSVVALRSRNSTSTQHTPRTPRIVVNSPQTF